MSLLRIAHRFAFVVCVIALTACQHAVKPTLDVCVSDPNSVACACKNPSSPACVCATSPDAAACTCHREGETSRACVCARDPSATQCQACRDGSAKTQTRMARKAFDYGNWAEGRRYLECALETQPQYSAASRLLETLSSDPNEYAQSTFGKDRTRYRVGPGESLGSIAQRCLGSVDFFVLLARLNERDVPRALSSGELLMIPGKKCAPHSSGHSSPMESRADAPPPSDTPIQDLSFEQRHKLMVGTERR